MKQEKCLECGAKVAEGHGWIICGNAVACSRKCANKAIGDYQTGRLRCWRCAEFLSKPLCPHTSSIVYGIYCSEECLNKAATDMAPHCPTCNKPFIGAPYVWRSADGSEYCSKECRDARANGWINVHDELPEGGKPVLVWVTSGQPRIEKARRGRHVAWFSEGTEIEEQHVTHWRPLPEPPIVEQDAPVMGRCKDCCFWDGRAGEYWGRCIKAAEPNALFGDTEGNKLPTRRDFGCVEFVRKGTSDD